MPGGTVKYNIVADAKPFVDATAQASKELKKLTDEAIGSAGALGRIADAAGPMGKSIAIVAGAGVAGFAALGLAIADSVKGLVDAGGKLADLSAQTGISTQALQKLAYAGSLVGVSQDSITGAAVKMQKAIADGDDVFQRLGLSVSKLKAMQPDQAFAAVAAQIAKIKNPTDQAAAAMEVFGKSGATLLPLIKSDLKAAGEEAERLGIILSDKTVSAADALGDEATKLGAAWEGVKNQFAAAIVENPALLDGLQKLVLTMGDLAQSLIKNKDEIGQWGASFIGWIERVGAKLIAIGSNPAVKFLNSALLKVAGYATGVGFLGGGEDGGPSAGRGTGHMAPGSSYADIGGGRGLDFVAKGSAAAAAAAKKAAAEAAKAWTDGAEKSRQADDKFTAGVKSNAYQQMLGIQNLFDSRGKAQSKELDNELKAEMAHRDMLLKLGEQNEAIFKAAQERKLAEMRGLAVALADLGNEIGGLAGAWVGFASGGLAAFANLKDEALQSATMWQKVTIAIEGAAAAYGAGKAAGSPGKGALAGAGKGAAAGSAFGPYGMVIGAVVGAGIGFFGGKKAQSEELSALNQQMRDLAQEAAHLGIALSHGFDPKNVKSMRQSVKDLDEAIRNAPMQDQFNKLVVAAQQAGIQFDHTFDTHNAEALKHSIEEIQHALDTQGEAQQKLNEATQRYGFTIEELGPAFARQKLDEQAGQLYQDYQLLIESGIANNTVISRMGPAVNDYVHAAVSAGQDIPIAMKPIIDKMIEQGLLLDANGNAYTSAEDAGITYAQTMSQMFQDLIKHVQDLVDAIRGIPDKTVNVTVNRRYNNTQPLNDDGTPDNDGDPTNSYASGGVFDPRPGGHIIRVAEGGQREWVLNPQQMAGMGGSSEEIRALRDDIRAFMKSQPKQIAAALVMAKA